MTSAAETAPEIVTASVPDPSAALRRAEWRYYLRRIPIPCFLGPVLAGIEYLRPPMGTWMFGLFSSLAGRYQQPPWVLIAPYLILQMLASSGPWLGAGLSWWTLRREWRTGRGRDLAVTPISSPRLFGAKYLPMMAALLLLSSIQLAARTGQEIWQVVSVPSSVLSSDRWTYLARTAGAEALVIIPETLLWPLAAWASMLLFPRIRGFAIIPALIALAFLQGLAAALANASHGFWDGPLFIAGLDIFLTALLALYVARRFRELLIPA